MKIAAIDVGSNSIHMIIAESFDGLDFQIVGREKEMVRLGAGTFETKTLSEAAMVRAEQCLRKYKQLAERMGVDRIIAHATSAVREAQNGGDFISRVHERVGIHIKVITSAEEARLIALAVQRSVDFRGRRALLIDIGGGSVELAVCDPGKIYLAESRKLGVIRLTEKFARRDPMSKKARRAIEKFAQKRIGELGREARKIGYGICIGSSGTILTLADVASQIQTGVGLRHFHQQMFSLDSLRVVNRRLQTMTLKERARFPSVSIARAKTIVAGGIVLEILMKSFEVKRLILSTRALREGMIFDYLQRLPETSTRSELVSDIRRRSVLDLARRSRYDQPHSEWVAQTALKIFDATQRRHQLNSNARALLEYGSLLHDIGIQLSFSRHHRHSQYMILNGDLRGFTPEEIDLMALLARFHRKGEPNLRDPECALMPRKEFETLRWLSAILRVTDGLDRSHHQILTLVSVQKKRARWQFEFKTREDAELELWGSRRKGELFEELFGGKLDFKVTLRNREKRVPSTKQARRRRDSHAD